MRAILTELPSMAPPVFAIFISCLHVGIASPSLDAKDDVSPVCVTGDELPGSSWACTDLLLLQSALDVTEELLDRRTGGWSFRKPGGGSKAQSRSKGQDQSILTNSSSYHAGITRTVASSARLRTRLLVLGAVIVAVVLSGIVYLAFFDPLHGVEEGSVQGKDGADAAAGGCVDADGDSDSSAEERSAKEKGFEENVQPRRQARRKRGYSISQAPKAQLLGVPLHHYQEMDEDVVTQAIASFIRDTNVMTSDSASFTYRPVRLILAGALFAFLGFLQGFLLMQMDLHVNAPAVLRIRQLYDGYVLLVYGGVNHTRISPDGYHRGIPEYYDMARFESLSYAEQGEVCSIPFANPFFLLTVILVWILTCVHDFRQAWNLFKSLIVLTPRIPTMNNSVVVTTDADEFVIVVGLSRSIKAVILFVFLLPRVFLTTALLWLGCRWLVASHDMESLLVNAVALEFILLLKDVLYAALVPDASKKRLRHVRVMPTQVKKSEGKHVFLQALIWISAAVIVDLLYVYVFQWVLPDYGWDVRPACDHWASIQRQALE